jgi:hypothetical protein
MNLYVKTLIPVEAELLQKYLEPRIKVIIFFLRHKIS